MTDLREFGPLKVSLTPEQMQLLCAKPLSRFHLVLWWSSAALFLVSVVARMVDGVAPGWLTVVAGATLLWVAQGLVRHYRRASLIRRLRAAEVGSE